MSLRKSTRIARNRTEAYNRISAHAARLVANCIVAYNAIILNTVYEKMVAEGE